MGRGVRDNGELSGYAPALNQSGRAALERPRPGTRGLSPMQTERTARRAYGSGSIFENGGSYFGKWRVDGRQIKRRLGPVRTAGARDGLTKSQAEARLRELMAEVAVEDVKVAASSTRRPNHYTVAEVGDLFIEHAREHRGLKETTLTDYAMHVRMHLAPFFGDLPIQRLDARCIEAFAKHLRTKKGQGRRGGKPLSPKSVRNYLGTLSALLNFAVRKKWLAASPMTAVDLPAMSTDAPLDELTFLEPGEVARLVEAAVPGEYHALDAGLYTMATYTGLRQGELRGLRWSSVDFARSTVHVVEGVTRGRRSSPKGRRRRTVPLAPPAAAALLELRASSEWTAPDDPVFACPSTGRPMARAGLMARYHEALVAAGLPATFSFHDLRHTFGTTMARAGVEVGTIQAWLGHADLATTQLYMHYAPQAEDAARIAAAFEPGTSRGTNLRLARRTERNSRAA
jgi:integrase